MYDFTMFVYLQAYQAIKPVDLILNFNIKICAFKVHAHCLDINNFILTADTQFLQFEDIASNQMTCI